MSRHKKLIIKPKPKESIDLLKEHFIEELSENDLEKISGGCGEVGTSFANFSRGSTDEREDLSFRLI